MTISVVPACSKKRKIFHVDFYVMFIIYDLFLSWKDNMCADVCIWVVISQHYDRCDCSDECVHRTVRHEGLALLCGCHGNTDRCLCVWNLSFRVPPAASACWARLAWCAKSTCVLFLRKDFDPLIVNDQSQACRSRKTSIPTCVCVCVCECMSRVLDLGIILCN